MYAAIQAVIWIENIKSKVIYLRPKVLHVWPKVIYVRLKVIYVRRKFYVCGEKLYVRHPKLYVRPEKLCARSELYKCGSHSICAVSTFIYYYHKKCVIYVRIIKVLTGTHRLVLSTMQILGGCFTTNLNSSVVLIQKRKRWWYVDIIGPYLFTHEISHLRIYRIKHEESKNNKPQRKKWAWVKNRQSPINSDVGLRCFRQLEVSMVAKLNNVELPQGGKGEQ